MNALDQPIRFGRTWLHPCSRIVMLLHIATVPFRASIQPFELGGAWPILQLVARFVSTIVHIIVFLEA
jgi:hypothetical protein